MKTIRVQTKEPYDVLVGAGILPTLGARVTGLSGKRYLRAVLVADDRVHGLYGRAAADSLRAAGLTVAEYTFPAGEPSKTMDTVMGMLTAFDRHELTRSDAVVALGGGVTGDMAGFAAAIYRRGIDYIQVPTTLLAAVDSSVGGKTAVNLPSGKNLVGAFRQPQLVLCDTNLLDTLDAETFADGMAEVVKYGCIGDPELFELLERQGARENVLEIIARSVEQKSDIVARDEHEHGPRQLLNFGHTLGHGIEKLSRYKTSHGRAVAVGMCLVAEACVEHGRLEPTHAGRIKALLAELGLPTRTTYPLADICQESLGDKKRLGNTLHLITLERIGKAAIHPISADRFPGFFGV